MTWFGQVWHIFKKDIRHLRWTLWLYTALLAVAVVLSVYSTITNMRNILTSFAVVLFGAFIVGPLVHDDNPVSDSAIWRSRPISHSAVLGSKILLLCMLLVVGLLAQVIAMLQFDPTAPQVIDVLVRSTWPLALILLWSAVIASQTRDLKMFVAASVVAPIVLLFALQFPPLALLVKMGSNGLDRVSNLGFGIIPVRIGVMLFVIAFLAVVYKGRIRKWPSRALATVAMLALIISLSRLGASSREVVDFAPLVDAPLIDAEFFAFVPPDQSRPIITVRPNVDRMRQDRQVVLSAPVVAVRFPNGDVKRFPLLGTRSDSRSIALSNGKAVGSYETLTNLHVVSETQALPQYNVKWILPQKSVADGTFSAVVTGATAAEHAALNSGLATFALESAVITLEPSEEMRVANTVGARTARNGLGVKRIRELDDLGVVTEWLSVAAVPDLDPLHQFGSANNGVGKLLVLVDEVSGTGVQLFTTAMRFSSTSLFVLPGAEFSSYQFSLSELKARLMSREQPVDGLFSDNAYIAVIGWKNPTRSDFKTAFKPAM